MAVMLDGSSTQTRTGRWLRALTPQMVMRFVPVLGVVGVPLAFLVSYERQMAKAQYFGIPVEFIHVQLADAVAPFLTIAVLLWPLFIALHEVERLGVARVANYVGGWIRLWFMLVAVAVAVASFGQSRHNNGIAAALLGTVIGLLVLYVLLWWIPPGVSWIGRKLHPCGWSQALAARTARAASVPRSVGLPVVAEAKKVPGPGRGGRDASHLSPCRPGLVGSVEPGGLHGHYPGCWPAAGGPGRVRGQDFHRDG